MAKRELMMNRTRLETDVAKRASRRDEGVEVERAATAAMAVEKARLAAKAETEAKAAEAAEEARLAAEAKAAEEAAAEEARLAASPSDLASVPFSPTKAFLRHFPSSSSVCGPKT